MAERNTEIHCLLPQRTFGPLHCFRDLPYGRSRFRV